MVRPSAVHQLLSTMSLSARGTNFLHHKPTGAPSVPVILFKSYIVVVCEQPSTHCFAPPYRPVFVQVLSGAGLSFRIEAWKPGFPQHTFSYLATSMHVRTKKKADLKCSTCVSYVRKLCDRPFQPSADRSVSQIHSANETQHAQLKYVHRFCSGAYL